MGDILMVLLPAGILVAVLWTLTTALRPRDTGISEAEKYQQDLARRSAAHYAEQVRLATAVRARLEANTRPSQNEQQQSQQADHDRAALQARTGSGTGAGTGAHGHLLPGGLFDPQLVMQLQTMARDGHKLQAIKLLRQTTHTDLATAKKYVDRL
jgi:ribosomal protein L7/L12